MDASKETNDESFSELKLLVSNWYDKHISIKMLKVLYRDHVKDTFALHEASKTMQLIDMLISSGNLSSNDLTLLYDTIKATETFGLEQEIYTQMPSFKISKNIRDNVIMKFTQLRQRLVKLGMALTPSDVEKISELYDEKHTDSWSLIMDLEHNMVICEDNMASFIENLKKLKLHQAIKALTEDIPKPPSNSGQTSVNPNISVNSGSRLGEAIHLGLKRRRIDEPEQKTPLDMVNELSENIDRLSVKDLPEFSTKFKRIYMYLKNINLHLDDISKGSIVFHLFVYDPYALMNLWEIHSSGELINDLAKLIIPDNLQEDFIEGWKTVVDGEEYESALRKLKERVQYDSFYGIVSDDMEWERQVVVDLTQRRPDFKFNILKHWRLNKPETIDDLIAKSSKIIIAFSPKALTKYSKYAAHSVVVQMLETKILDNAKIIPVKISEDSVLSPLFESFTVISASDEHFVDKVLQDLIECEETESVTPDVLSPTALEGTSEELSSDENKTQLVEISKTLKGTSEELSSGEHKTQLVGTSERTSEEVSSDELETPLVGTSENINLRISRKRKHEESEVTQPKNPLELLNEVVENLRYLKVDDMLKFLQKYEEISKYFDNIDKHEETERSEELSSDEVKSWPVGRSEKKRRFSTGSFFQLFSEYPSEDIDVEFDEKLILDRPKHFQKVSSKKFSADSCERNVSGDLRHFVAGMLLRKECFVKGKGLNKGKEYENEYSIKSSQGVDDSQPSFSQEVPIEGIMEYESHIEDICNSLRLFSHHMIPHKKVITDEQIIQLMSKQSNWRYIQHLMTTFKNQSSEDIGRIFAHVLIAVQYEEDVLKEIHELCTNDIVSSLSAECKKLNFKYDITGFYISFKITVSFLIHLLCNAPRLERLTLLNCNIKGVTLKKIVDALHEEGAVLELIYLNISENNLSAIKGSSLATLLAVAPKLKYLDMRNCSLSGCIMVDMVKECSIKAVVLELIDLDISENNISDIKGSMLATLLAVAPKLNYLFMKNCRLSGAIMDDMVKECFSRGVVVQL